MHRRPQCRKSYGSARTRPISCRSRPKGCYCGHPSDFLSLPPPLDAERLAPDSHGNKSHASEAHPMPKTLVSSIRPPPVVRPPPSDRRAKNRLLAPLPVDDIRRFLLDLTTIPVREPQVFQKQGAPRVIPRLKPSAPLRILIVDPDADTRSLYRAFVQLAGGDVVEASDGRDALVKALMHPPALVMTETRLPIIDGFALCEGLRRDVMTRAVPILVVTGDTGPAVLERARTAGADATLVKPSLDAVLSEIRRLLQLPRTSAPCGTMARNAR
jgi:two-component system chemotaxis response regulator CheY